MREALLVSARTRLATATARGDPADLRTEAAAEELAGLTAILATQDGLDREVMRVLGNLHHLRAGPGDGRDRARAAALLLPLFLEDPSSVPDALQASFASMIDEDDHPSAIAASILSRVLLAEFAGGHRQHGVAAVTASRQALTDLPVDHPYRPSLACDLGLALLGVEPDRLNEALALLQDSFAHTPPDHGNHARCANGLAIALQTKAIRTDDLPLLDEAIRHFRIARRSPSLALADRAEVLARLGMALRIWLTNTPLPHIARRDEAIAALREAIELTPKDAPQLPALEQVLEEALSTPALPEGVPPLLDVVATILGRDATGDSRHAQLAEFGRTVQDYPDRASLADVLAKAQQVAAHQVEHLPPAKRAEVLRSASSDAQLALSRLLRYDDSLDEVADLLERLARELSDDDPHMTAVRYGVLVLKLLRSQHQDGPITRDSLDRRSATLAELSAQMAALSKADDGLIGFARAVATIAQASLSPFESLARIDDAVRDYRAQLRVSPDDLPTMTSLAHRLFVRYVFTQAKAEYEEALALARRVVARTSPPDPGLVSHWAQAAMERAQRSRLDTRATGSGSPSRARLAVTAAATAIGLQDGPGALEKLEDGRALLLSAEVAARQDLASLRRLAPALAGEFGALREQVYADTASVWEYDPGTVERRREQLRQWDHLVHRIVALPGLDRFMLPLPLGLTDLLPAAVDGPVVTVNVSESHCDALVLTTDGVRIVPLPELRAEDVARHARACHRALASLDADLGVLADRVLSKTLRWLWDALAEPVLTAIDLTEPPHDGRWPRLWWSPTGLLNLLPLHAAGYHDEPGLSVLDRVVSSYTPTLRALLRSRSHPIPDRRTALSVAAPHTSHQVDLPGTVREISAVAHRFPGQPALIGPAATREAVRRALPTASVTHLACHAIADAANSRLVLADASLPISEISQLSLEGTELAYLSACATAQGTIDLADEAVHAASAFQLAGYAQVVATLWVVGDHTAARVARRFYDNLTITDGARLDGALALHTVTRELRGQPSIRPHPTRWAGWLHAGA